MKRFWSLLAAGSTLITPNVSPGAPRRSNPETATSTDAAARPDAIRARSEHWQAKILEYAEAIPEVAGASALVRASMEGVRWVVEGGDSKTRDRIQARVDAFDKERAAELVWLSGECYVACPSDPGSDKVEDVADVEPPFSLSVLELTPARDGSSRDQVVGPNGEMVDLVEEKSDEPVPFFRIWRKAKSNRWKGSSPNKSVMDLLDAMYVAQLVDTATQNSRLIHAGIVFWPTNLPSVYVEPGEEPEPGTREFLQREFSRATSAKVDLLKKGEDSAKPFIVMYDPGTGSEATKYEPTMFRVERDDLADQRSTRVEVDRRRYATSCELPVEAVEGMGGTNHWSAWQIDVDKWKTWFAPIDKLLREQFEARVVKQYGKQFTLKSDATELIKKPDLTDVIIKLMQLEQVTPESGLKALISGDLADLQWQKPPQKPTQGVAPGQPSDFGKGDTDRGGGKFREQA